MRRMQERFNKVQGAVNENPPDSSKTPYVGPQCGLPEGYFVIVFRNGNLLELINPPDVILNEVKQILESPSLECSSQSKKEFSTGVQFQLRNDPFESGNLKSSYQLFKKLVETLLDCGCEMCFTGHLFKNTNRSVWIMKYDKNKCCSNLSTTRVAIFGMENSNDSNKLVLYDSPNQVHAILKDYISRVWTSEILYFSTEEDFHVVELEQWNSHGSGAEVSPLIIEFLLTQMKKEGYCLHFSTHLRGSTDTLFFIEKSSDSPLSKICSMSLCKQKEMKFYNIPADILDKVRTIVTEIWNNGMSMDPQSSSLDMWNLTLQGSPWWTRDYDRSSVIKARKLITEICHVFKSRKWNLLTSMVIYRSEYDKTLFIFQLDDADKKECAELYQRDVTTIAVTPTAENKILIQNGSKLTEEIIRKHAKLSSQETYLESDPYACEFNLDGSPWFWPIENSKHQCDGIRLMCFLYDDLINSNYMLATAADISSNTKYSPFTWIFTKSTQ